VPTPSRRKIGRQIVLPFSKAFEIAWKGIRIRLWRSLITMSGIVLAIAFLTSVWTSGAFTEGLRRVEGTHELYPLVRGVLEAEAVASGGVAVDCVVIQGQQEEVEGAITVASSIRDSLDAMSAFRAQLVPPEPKALAAFLTADEGVRPDAVIAVGAPPGLQEEATVGALRQFLREGGFLLLYGATGLSDLDPDSALAELLPAVPGEETFVLEAEAVTEAQPLGAAWRALPPTTVLTASGRPGGEALASAGDRGVVWSRPIGKGTVVWYPVAGQSAVDPDHVSWFVRARPVSVREGADKRSSLGVRLIAYGCREQFAGGDSDVRGMWLVSLSLMVCVVGITNAMLMSVTERFREIGTMKCLGALDKFIVKLFIIESSLQGVVGSVAGALIGFTLAFLRALLTFHVRDPETGRGYWLTLRFFPTVALLQWIGVALVTGIILTVVAAIYPAIRAARMEPVQAMRAEA
jgi:hypothetical protein